MSVTRTRRSTFKRHKHIAGEVGGVSCEVDDDKLNSLPQRSLHVAA